MGCRRKKNGLRALRYLASLLGLLSRIGNGSSRIVPGCPVLFTDGHAVLKQLQLFPKRKRLGPFSILRALLDNRCIPKAFLEIELPSFPNEWTNEEVGLKRRFRFVLTLPEVREGGLTLRCALSIPRFGFRGLISYLQAYCRYPGLLRGFEEATEYDPRLAKRVAKLIRSVDDWSLSPRDLRFGRRVRDQLATAEVGWPTLRAPRVRVSFRFRNHATPQNCGRWLTTSSKRLEGLSNMISRMCAAIRATNADVRFSRRYYGLKGRRPKLLKRLVRSMG